MTILRWNLNRCSLPPVRLFLLQLFSRQENIGAFWSWENPTKRPDWDRAVNVDMIMNMEIMLWAAVNGGDSAYIDAVET